MGGQKGGKGGKGGKGKKGKGKWAYGDQDVIRILIKRYTAIDLLNALLFALGVVVNPKTKGKGKKGKGKKKGGSKPPKPVGKLRSGGRPPIGKARRR
jgi:hypothetical protein